MALAVITDILLMFCGEKDGRQKKIQRYKYFSEST
jgi:hypothetical protein